MCVFRGGGGGGGGGEGGGGGCLFPHLSLNKLSLIYLLLLVQETEPQFLTLLAVSLLINYTGMFPVGDTSCRTLIDVCVCVCVCVSVCPPTYR